MAFEPSAKPLLERHPEFNVTTQRLARNISKPFGSPSTPLLEAHELRQTQSSSWTSLFPDLESPRLRRKPCRSNLARALYEPATIEARVTCSTPALASSAQHQPVSSSLLPPSTSTPLSYPATSPSLSSTISTLQSTPTRSPTFPGRSWFQHCGGADDQAREVPVASKRKFPSFRAAKRLPRRAAGDWYIYAAVIETEHGIAGLTKRASGSDSDASRYREADRRVKAKGGRSVRFAGIAEASLSGTDQSASGEEKETTEGSTYSLSKFKFPTPPGHVTWADTFGHLGEPTPPTSPATLHYRGASFIVVNPHASLLLGKPDLETPAEIDGLLDDYFAERTDMPYDELTGEMSSASLEAGNDGSRRGRMLYDDPESARRTIMRIPGASTMAPADQAVDQESPLDGRGHASNMPLGGTQSRQTGDTQPSAPVYGVQREDSALSAGVLGDRDSSLYPHSVRSDPFDLYVSDDDEPQYNNIDQMVASRYGRPYANYLDARDESGEMAVYDEGADAEAPAFQDDKDTTIGNIVEAYDYSGRLRPLGGDDDQTLTGNPSLASIEHGRGMVTPNYETGASWNGRGYHPQGRVNERYAPSGQYGGPPSQQGSPGMPALTTPRRFVTQQDSPELHTSERTYGATGELLQISPAARAQGSTTYPWPTGGSSIPAMDFEDDGYLDDDKENIPPSDSVMVLSPATGIPAAWSNVDLPAPVRASLIMEDRGLSGFPMARVSSHYSGDDEAAWEDTQASESQPNFFSQPYVNEMPQRQSQISYANTSDNGSEHGMFPPPRSSQGQPSLQQVRTRDGSGMTAQFSNKAHRVLFGPPREPAQDRTRRPADESDQKMTEKRAKDLLKANMEQNNILGKLGPGLYGFGSSQEDTPAVDKDQMRRDEIELERLRKQNRPAVQKAAQELADEALKRTPRQRRAYDPHNSFENIIEKLGLKGDTRSVTSSRRGLLEEHRSPQSPGELAYSPTVNTFKTIPHDAPPMPGLVPQGLRTVETTCWSPLSQPHRAMTPRGRAVVTPSSAHTANVEDYELNDLRRYGASRPAMSSQTGLLPIQLTSSIHDSTVTSFEPGRRLTDAELMEREPRWSVVNSRRTGRSRLGLDLPVNTITEPMLLHREELANAEMIKEQNAISQRYFCACALCPVTALLFGTGYFDGKAQAASKGRVMEMRPRDKRWALYIAAPLGVMFYSIIVIGVILILALVHVL